MSEERRLAVLRAIVQDYVDTSEPVGSKALLDRHKREQRRVRTADLRSGLAALVARYRDALAEGAEPEVFLTAADAVQSLADALVFNPNETLQLQALFVALPRCARRGGPPTVES